MQKLLLKAFRFSFIFFLIVLWNVGGADPILLGEIEALDGVEQSLRIEIPAAL